MSSASCSTSWWQTCSTSSFGGHAPWLSSKLSADEPETPRARQDSTAANRIESTGHGMACVCGVATGCATSPPEPTIDYKSGYGFNQMRTFAFLPQSGGASSNSPKAFIGNMEANRIDLAFERAMQNKGLKFVKDPNQADMMQLAPGGPGKSRRAHLQHRIMAVTTAATRATIRRSTTAAGTAVPT